MSRQFGFYLLTLSFVLGIAAKAGAHDSTSPRSSLPTVTARSHMSSISMIGATWSARITAMTTPTFPAVTGTAFCEERMARLRGLITPGVWAGYDSPE
jgi:uncharacterized membrane protein